MASGSRLASSDTSHLSVSRAARGNFPLYGKRKVTARQDRRRFAHLLDATSPRNSERGLRKAVPDDMSWGTDVPKGSREVGRQRTGGGGGRVRSRVRGGRAVTGTERAMRSWRTWTAPASRPPGPVLPGAPPASDSGVSRLAPHARNHSHVAVWVSLGRF